MEFLQELYLGRGISSSVDKIVKKIKSDKIVKNLYLITMATNTDNMMEIVPQKEITQKGYPKEHLHIIGLADGYYDAVSLVQRIIEEVYQQTNSADVRKYLQAKWEEQV